MTNRLRVWRRFLGGFASGLGSVASSSGGVAGGSSSVTSSRCTSGAGGSSGIACSLSGITGGSACVLRSFASGLRSVMSCFGSVVLLGASSQRERQRQRSDDHLCVHRIFTPSDSVIAS